MARAISGAERARVASDPFALAALERAPLPDLGTLPELADEPATESPRLAVLSRGMRRAVRSSQRVPVVGDLGEEVCEVGRVEGSDVKYPIRAALARYKDGSLRVGLNRVLDSAKGLVNFRLGRMDADEALGVAKLLTRAAKMMKSRRRKR